MKKALLPLAIAAALPTFAMAEGPIDGKVYGKLNLTVENIDDGSDSTTEVKSNASRLGFKGKTDISESLAVIYKLEFEVNADDGKSSSSKGSDTFEQRNIYVGLTGDWGTALVGRHDTPFKLSQGKVDLFNDLPGDIKYLVDGEVRASNTVVYTTPKFADAISVSAAWIASEDADVDDGVSVAVSYDDSGLYLSAAFDQNVVAEDADSTRLTATYSIDALQIGALWQTTDTDSNGSQDGYVVSAAYKIDAITLKAQYGSSEILGGKYVENTDDQADMWSIGADYKLAKKTKAFAFYTTADNDSDTVDFDAFGIGLEHKF